MNLTKLWERWRRHGRLLLVAGLTVVAYLGALNRDNVQVWVIAALMLSTLLVGTIWPRWMTRRIEASRTCPERATEGEAVNFVVTLRNRGWLPRYMIGVLDRLPLAGLGPGRVDDTLLAQVAYLGSAATERIEATVAFERRGLFEIGPVSLETRFPLGLAESRIPLHGGRTFVLVYPSLFTVAALALRGTPRLIHRGALLLSQGTGSAEFRGLREYRPRDNPRHIHWPTSARLNRLMVREFEPMASASIQIVLDLHRESDAGSGRHSVVEYGIRIAGSIARFACERGMPVRLVGAGEELLDVPALSGEVQLAAILRNLAMAEARGAEPYGAVLQRVATQMDPGENVILFRSGMQAHAESFLEGVAVLRQKGAHLMAFVFDRDSFHASRTQRDGDAVQLEVAGLRDLGVDAVLVRNGDDLEAVLNR